MAELKPYKALIYGQNYRSQIDKLISPPYDVINAQQHTELVNKHPYNSVQLSLVDNTEDPQAYQNLGKRLQQWKQESVLETFQEPSFYLIEETYHVEGETKTRLGFTGLLKLSPFQEGVVQPHEHTLSGPKKDRYQMLEHMGADTSQVFMCYQDPGLLLEKLHQKYSQKPALLSIPEFQGVKRSLWAIEETQDTQSIVDMMRDKKLLIADGHHRYETALKFHEDRKRSDTQYAHVYFTNAESSGFTILPIHRIFSLPEEWDFDSFSKSLKDLFHCENYTGSLHPSSWKTSEDDIEMLCCFGPDNRKFKLSRKKQGLTDAEIFSLQRDVFEKIFQWDISKISKGLIHFEHSTQGFEENLKKTPRAVGFMLPPLQLEQVRAVIDQGERMPQKSTFFYPKIASGLVIYELGSG